jgi:hypothetical protein
MNVNTYPEESNLPTKLETVNAEKIPGRSLGAGCIW